MLRAWRGLAILLIPISLTSTALAQTDSTYRERRMMQDQSRKLAKEADYTSDVCGTRISASLVWDSFLARDGRVSSSIFRECDGALSAIERICREERKIEAVRNKIDRVECGGGKKTRVRLEDGTLRYAISKGDASHEEVYEYLMKRL